MKRHAHFKSGTWLSRIIVMIASKSLLQIMVNSNPILWLTGAQALGSSISSLLPTPLHTMGVPNVSTGRY
jgi:hypothetical protein